MIKFTAPARARLAKLVAEQGGLPYSAVRRLLRGKDIKLNGKRVNTDLTCEKGDLIEVYVRLDAEKQALDSLYADENVLVFNKPSGITSEDFYDKVRAEYPTARAVHRLDRNTRGIIAYALTDVAEEALLSGFKQRTFTKLYLAEVIGRPKQDEATLSAYLNKDAETGTVYIHDRKQPGDVQIKTAYRVLRSSGSTSVLEVELLTGRTHQIRAHLSHIGHPIIGDEKYGDTAVNKIYRSTRQHLQAYRLVLRFEEDSPLYYLNGREFSLSPAFGKEEV